MSDYANNLSVYIYDDELEWIDQRIESSDNSDDSRSQLIRDAVNEYRKQQEGQ